MTSTALCTPSRSPTCAATRSHSSTRSSAPRWAKPTETSAVPSNVHSPAGSFAASNRQHASQPVRHRRDRFTPLDKHRSVQRPDPGLHPPRARTSPAIRPTSTPSPLTQGTAPPGPGIPHPTRSIRTATGRRSCFDGLTLPPGIGGSPTFWPSQIVSKRFNNFNLFKPILKRTPLTPDRCRGEVTTGARVPTWPTRPGGKPHSHPDMVTVCRRLQA